MVWIIHENSLGIYLRLYIPNEHRKHISDWRFAFGRAVVIVFPDDAMSMMYSMLDYGNFLLSLAFKGNMGGRTFYGCTYKR